MVIGRQAAKLTVLTLLLAAFSSPGHVEDCGWPYPGGRVIVVTTEVTDNGDGDGFADTNETLQIGLTVSARGYESIDSLHCNARLSTDSPAVECMPRAQIFIGNVPVYGPPVTPTEKFEIKIGDVDRQSLGLGPEDPLDAVLTLDIFCTNRSSPSQEIRLPLDLDAWDLGQTPTPWFEGFEDETLGQFHAQNNDAGMPGADNGEGLENADGWRCQYTDPDWINSETYNSEASDDCFPGMNLAHADAVFWQVDGASVVASPDGGRAKSGAHSMYYGVFIDQPADDLFTTPMATVEAVGTTDPINLGVGAPKLSFWHQVSLADHRRSGHPFRDREAFDRGLLQIQLADATDTIRGDWTKLSASVNPYDATIAENHFACSFDPVDDGNTEDDFFDPTDPDREWGPSSTCPPEWNWSFMGDTSPAPFNVDNVGRATTPPTEGDAPSLGTGTWVRSEFDLAAFRGRRARLRFLVTSLKATAESWYEQFGSNEEKDDGWWIDDVNIDDALSQPAEFSNDTFLLGSCSGTGEPCIEQCRLSRAPCSATIPCNPGEGDCVAPCPQGETCSGAPPDCGADCSVAQVNVFVDPAGLLNPASVSTDEPGEKVCFNAGAAVDMATGAEPSWVDTCIDGTMEFRFCISGDPDGSGPGQPDDDCEDFHDRDWPSSPGWNPYYNRYARPEVVTTYAVEMRCSTVPECRDGETIEVFVNCPSGEPNTLGLREMRALDRDMLVWQGVLDVDWLRGSFVTAADIGDYDEDFTGLATSATSIPMAGDPPVGTGYYYLVKADGPASPFVPFYDCDTVTWRSGGMAEKPEPARNFSFGDP